MNSNSLVDVAAAPLSIAPAITPSKLANLENGKARVVTNGSESLHCKAVLIVGNIKSSGHLADAGERRIAELARSTVELGDLSELERLSEALTWLKGNRIRTAADLAAKGAGNPEMAAYVQGLGIFREGSAERRNAPRPSKPFSRAQGASAQRSNTAEHTNEHHREHQRDDGRESQR